MRNYVVPSDDQRLGFKGLCDHCESYSVNLKDVVIIEPIEAYRISACEACIPKITEES